MEKIKSIYINAKVSFVLSIFNILIVLFLLCTIDEMTQDHIIFLALFGFAPSLLFLIMVLLGNIFKNKVIVHKIIRIISVVLILPYIFYLMFLFFVYIMLVSINPEVKLGSYEYSSDINYFPKTVPKEYEDAAYYHKYPFLQGGEEIILYLKLDRERILEYKSDLENKNIERNREMIGIESKFYNNTPYQEGITKDFQIYTIESKCDDSGYCNHGLDKHVVINEKTNEIIFYYGNW